MIALTVTAALVVLSSVSGGAVAEPSRVAIPRFESGAVAGGRVLAKRSKKARARPTRKEADSPPPVVEADRTSEKADKDGGDGDDQTSPTAGEVKEKETEDEGGAGKRPRSRRASSSTSREDSDADVAATAEADEPSAPDGPWLEVGLGARTFSRNLTYHQMVTPTQRQHQVLGPAGVLDVAFYPLALAMGGPAANIGLVAHFEQAFATNSQLDPDSRFPNGATFPTSMQEISGGLRVRIPWESWQLGVTVTGGQHALWFSNSSGADRGQLEIPNVIYRFARGGVDANITVAPQFSLGAGAGYRFVFNGAGEVGKIFPHLTVGGVDAEVHAAYAITRNIQARVEATARRYFFDMHSVAADATIAGGAVDQYLSLGAQLAVTLDRLP